MRESHRQMLRELDADGVLDDLFDKVRSDTHTHWENSTSTDDREMLWQRLRALRDVRRAVRAQIGVDD